MYPSKMLQTKPLHSSKRHEKKSYSIIIGFPSTFMLTGPNYMHKIGSLRRNSFKKRMKQNGFSVVLNGKSSLVSMKAIIKLLDRISNQ
jgi:hypothetical protein